MRRQLLSALLFGAAVLSAPPAIAGEAEMQALVAKKVAILSNLHKKAERALVNAAQDKVFIEYFSAAEADRPALKKRIDQLALNVQSNFKVEEMCLIDDHGHEISRIVGNAVAPDHDLSKEEADASFFKPTMAKEAKQVFVTPAYLSPDAGKWTVAYVTPIVAAGRKAALLHYEYSLDEFRQALDKDVGGDVYVLAIDGHGHVLSDSRKQPDIARRGDKEALPDYFPKVSDALAKAITLGGEGVGSFEDGGARHSVAYKTVEDWTVAAVERAR